MNYKTIDTGQNLTLVKEQAYIYTKRVLLPHNVTCQSCLNKKLQQKGQAVKILLKKKELITRKSKEFNSASLLKTLY